MKQLFTFTFILFFCLTGKSQMLPRTDTDSDTILYEKLYLHVDREFYAPGDDVWFKSYLVSGINHKPIPGFKNVYVELIAEDGRIIDRRLMLSINGVANNDFHLPDTLSSGQYTIRGYTKYLQNFEEESLFHQKIAVVRTSDLPETRKNSAEQDTIDVSFLPEGGSLVMNAANHIAFKAIDKSGKGIPVSGKVVDQTGLEAAAFKTTCKGMGRFLMMPQEGKKYTALIDGHPDFSIPFEDARPDGVTLHYRENGINLQFILNRNFKSTGKRNLTLKVSHKSKELFHEAIEMNDFQHPISIYKGHFPLGISKVTLLDEQSNILAERLVFVRNADDKPLTVTTDKKEYRLREKIDLQVESLLPLGEDSIATGLSVAVVNENYFSQGGKTQTLESYLLLDSELKGPLESSAALFTDEQNLTAGEKLDLVMMVNGWRRYYWDDLLEYFDKPLPGWDDTGITVEGEVKSLSRKESVIGGTVEFGPFSGEFLILKDTIVEAGRFSFKRLYLKDSAQVMVNAFNEKGKRNVEVNYEPTALFDTVVPYEEIYQAARNVELHENHNQTSFNRHLAEREFELEKGSILLGEVDVIEEYKSGTVVTAKHGFRDRELMLSGKDKEEYSSIVKYLEFEALGIFLDEEDNIRIGLAKEPPKFYVDDLEITEDFIKTLPVDEIVKVEIFNPRIKLGVIDNSGYGLPKDGGAISILTKNRYETFHQKFVRNINGRIIVQVPGFHQIREYYTPVYPLEEPDSSKNPDYRPTMHWEPYVHLKKNKANVEFYASDMPGPYHVIVEGISTKGKAIFGTMILDVRDSELPPAPSLPVDKSK